MTLSFFLAASFAQSLDILFSRDILFVLLILLNFLWIITGIVIKLYDAFSNRPFAYHLINLFKMIIVQVVFSIMFIFFIKEDLFTRNFIIGYSLILVFSVIIKEGALRKIISLLREQGRGVRELAIIGANEIGFSFKELILTNPNYGFKFIGFITLSNDEDSNQPNSLGKITELENLIKQNGIRDIVVALPLAEYKLLDEIIRTCDKNAVTTYIIPDYFKFLSEKFKINLFGSFPIITVRNNPLEEIQWRFVKHTFDLLFTAIIFILVLSWLLPIIAVMIKITSKGPVFFIQDRIGKFNEKFRCYKFRTMTINEKAGNKFIPVTKDDQRVTKIGRILRITSLDELPQFINVLLGDMSIVGPRPHAIAYDNSYADVVDEIRLRHRVKPGITGWAQIHGLRGDVFDFQENVKRTRERIQHDIWYIENWRFWLDIQIIFETVWQIASGRNKGN
ncbi:MAG: undecaprenyl-phosphate glucose phosphotransferase [Melioribacteraceae bacterium]|nr:undecaprenyl-phosphate glucose phosphotransferase [Melioribacteraceae bacterium]MCF8353482.1 undecaprenyl-phosphate glucose phosphotransferase [Melioribacteraceae bacterium]MCF8392611.1 undecaprenyl-phosphate glucose phosphotransferase [Melioribacteraceae bacterium]MCF8418517.1 undecaprenyl-phosphate glucose phosphotransferase [Melioribacteraceae bacterium]